MCDRSDRAAMDAALCPGNRAVGPMNGHSVGGRRRAHERGHRNAHPQHKTRDRRSPLGPQSPSTVIMSSSGAPNGRVYAQRTPPPPV